MQVTNMMFVVERSEDHAMHFMRVRSADDKITHYRVPILKNSSEAELRKAVKDCMSWAIENTPLNTIFIVNTSI